jgi:hypothetical protein
MDWWAEFLATDPEAAMFNSWLYQIFLEAVGLEQGIIEELLE